MTLMTSLKTHAGELVIDVVVVETTYLTAYVREVEVVNPIDIHLLHPQSYDWVGDCLCPKQNPSRPTPPHWKTQS